ncbi:MAG: amidohydrolase family protein, partial [Gammaproteobacteria bacterium]|nr:amidohydrolase family protein [Gammaproteobacteria bacterium]
VMIHAQTVRDDQLDRMAALAMVPSFFSTHTFFWGDWHRDSVLGIDRASRISPTRSSINRGITFTVHNDAPIVPPDMLQLLWSTTNRLTRSNQVLGPDERLTTYEALAAITRDAAYQYFEEDRKGTLAAGKLADLVILSSNPLDTPTVDLRSLEVTETWSHGMRTFNNISSSDVRGR